MRNWVWLLTCFSPNPPCGTSRSNLLTFSFVVGGGGRSTRFFSASVGCFSSSAVRPRHSALVWHLGRSAGGHFGCQRRRRRCMSDVQPRACALRPQHLAKGQSKRKQINMEACEITIKLWICSLDKNDVIIRRWPITAHLRWIARAVLVLTVQAEEWDICHLAVIEKSSLIDFRF